MQHLVNGSTQNPRQVLFSFIWQFRLISHNTTWDWATCNTKCWCQSMHADTRHLGNAVWKGLGVSARVHTAWNLLQWTWHKKSFFYMHQHIRNSECKTDICPMIKQLIRLSGWSTHSKSGVRLQARTIRFFALLVIVRFSGILPYLTRWSHCLLHWIWGSTKSEFNPKSRLTAEFYCYILYSHSWI